MPMVDYVSGSPSKKKGEGGGTCSRQELGFINILTHKDLEANENRVQLCAESWMPCVVKLP
jgi:hypothetical protein